MHAIAVLSSLTLLSPLSSVKNLELDRNKNEVVAQMANRLHLSSPLMGSNLVGTLEYRTT